MNSIFSSAVSVVCAAGLMLGGNRLVFTPKEETAPVVNPHKGFVQHIDNFNASSSSAKLTDILYDDLDADSLKSGEGFILSSVDASLEKCTSTGRTFAIGIYADEADDCETMKNCAKALAARYDGRSSIEFISIELPEAEESVQKSVLDSFDDAFEKTPLAFSSNHKLYSYAESLGMFSYNDEAFLETVQRSSYIPLDEASYNANVSLAEELQNKTGYNFVIKYASFYYDKNEAVLSVKIKNTGSEAQSFPVTLEAAVSDKNGTSFTRTGSTAVIASGSHGSGDEQTYEIRFDRSLIPNKNDVYIAVGAFEDKNSLSPDIKFANKLTGNTNYIILGKVK